jgi:hypothetical protein
MYSSFSAFAYSKLIYTQTSQKHHRCVQRTKAVLGLVPEGHSAPALLFPVCLWVRNLRLLVSVEEIFTVWDCRRPDGVAEWDCIAGETPQPENRRPERVGQEVLEDLHRAIVLEGAGDAEGNGDDDKDDVSEVDVAVAIP